MFGGRQNGSDNNFGTRCLLPQRLPESIYINQLAHTLPRVLWGAEPEARMNSADSGWELKAQGG